MQDPTEPDRQDILDGPGDHRRSGRNHRKIITIAASVLVAALAVGGVGYALTSGEDAPGQTSQQARLGDQATPAEDTGDRPQDKKAETDDAPAEDTADDGVRDTVADAPDTDTSDTGTAGNPDTSSADTGSAGTDTRDRDEPKTGDRPAKKPTTKPTKPAQQDTGDTPADGPAGEVSGQCAASGC